MIAENNRIVYVGRSYRYLVRRMHAHFYRTAHEFLVEYSRTLETKLYKVALIEVPSVGKSLARFKEEIKSLENRLIEQFQPRDNIKGRGDADYPWDEEIKKMATEYGGVAPF